jgi:hypothetical protein
MLYLDSESKKDMNIYINCSGGEVVPSLAIHDTMRHIKSDVGTVGFGGCMGMSGFLLAVGKKVGARGGWVEMCRTIEGPRGSRRLVLSPCAALPTPPASSSEPARSAPCCAVCCVQGKRYALQNTRIMVHHPSGAARGQVRRQPVPTDKTDSLAGLRGWRAWHAGGHPTPAPFFLVPPPGSCTSPLLPALTCSRTVT